MELPEELLNSLTLVKGFDREAFIKVHQDTSRITSIRLNTHKMVKLPFELNSKIPWTENGYYLKQRPYFTHDPLFHAGCYYVQEPGSMILEQYVRVGLGNLNDPKVLDLCAAPGGKSTLISNFLGNKGLLVANEFVKSRSSILARNLSKWGMNNTIVTNNPPSSFEALADYFDMVITDVPCSGSGLFRKQPEAIKEWNLENVKNCSIRQKEIMDAAVKALKVNGMLVYSTCSYSYEENENIVSWLLRNYSLQPVEIPIDPSWGLVESEGGLRFYPYLTGSEGFFVAAFLKKEGEIRNYRPKKKLKKLNNLGSWINQVEGSAVEVSGKIHYCSNLIINFLEENHPSLFYRKAGILMGEIKGKDFIPDQELAYTPTHASSIQKVELDQENALLFLKKQTFKVDPETGNGLFLACFQGYGLGWFKKLPNRINNYLPQDLMVLH